MIVKEWELKIEGMDTRTLLERAKSLKELLRWVTFKTEFNGLGLEVLESIMLYELNTRKVDLHTIDFQVNTAYLKKE